MIEFFKLCVVDPRCAMFCEVIGGLENEGPIVSAIDDVIDIFAILDSRLPRHSQHVPMFST
jgi:hypothetical protein